MGLRIHLTKEERLELEKLRGEGWYLKALAEKFGTHRGRIEHYLDHPITPRKPKFKKGR